MDIQRTVNRHPAAVAIVLFLNFVILVSVASHFLIGNLENIEKTMRMKICTVSANSRSARSSLISTSAGGMRRLPQSS